MQVVANVVCGKYLLRVLRIARGGVKIDHGIESVAGSNELVERYGTASPSSL